MKKYILLLLMLSNTSFSEKMKERDLDLAAVNNDIDLKWNYNYSSDVLFGEVIKNRVVKTNKGKCKVVSSIIEVKESFKGSYQPNQLLNVVGLDAHEITAEKSFQLFFLMPLEVEGMFGECASKDYKNYYMIHNWCCSVLINKEAYLVMYDMLDSETKSANYLVKSEVVFSELRKLQKK